MIDGAKITPLRSVPDERGRLMEMMRSDEAISSSSARST